jgi:hypothetical protein
MTDQWRPVDITNRNMMKRWLTGFAARREWAWDDYCLMGYYTLLAVSGTFGVYGLSSPAVEIGLGTLVSAYVFSGIFVVMGVLGVIARWRRARRAEIIVIVTLAMATLIHGLLIVIVASGTGTQTGLRLVAAPLMMIPFAAFLARVSISPRDIQKAQTAGRLPEDEHVQQPPG